MEGAKVDGFFEEKVIRELWAGGSVATDNSATRSWNQNNDGSTDRPDAKVPVVTAYLLNDMVVSDCERLIRPVVCICNENIPAVAINKLNESFRTVILKADDSRETVLKKLRGVHGLFMYGHGFRLDAQMLDAIGDSLKVVGLMSNNFDNVDVRELTRRSVRIGSARCEVVDTVAETAVGLALTVAHRFKTASVPIHGSVQQTSGYNKMLKDGRCGIVGSGDVGTAIARRLMSFGASDIFYSVHRRSKTENYGAQSFVDFDYLLRESDFIFVICPITEKTKNLFDYKAFSRMKPTCVFISVSSWGIIKMKDLVRALRERLIWGAGLDMPESVQLSQQHPLLVLDNCFVTPRLGTGAARTRERMALVTAENILRGIQGTKMPCQICFKVERSRSTASRNTPANKQPTPNKYPSYIVIL